MPKSNYTAWNVDPLSWKRAASPTERLRLLAAYGVLAPSPHNCQPWIFEIEDDQLRLGIDHMRTLPVSDPTGRQMPLAIGCVVGTLESAAKAVGAQLEIDWTEDSPWLCAVRIGESDQEADDSYRRAILNRHSDRRPYLSELGEIDLDSIALASTPGSWIQVLQDRREIAVFADAVAEATMAFGADQAFRRELAGWLRPNETADPDGMPGTVMGFKPLQTIVMKKILPIVNTGKPMAKQSHAQCVASGAILLIGTDVGSSADAAYFAVGRSAVTAAIEATRLGLATSWIAAAAESELIATRLEDELGLPGDLIVALRVGVGPQPSPSPTPRRTSAEVTRQGPPPIERKLS